MKKKTQIGRKLLAALLAASLLNVAVLAAAKPAPEAGKEPVLQEEAVPPEKVEDLPEKEKEEEEPAPEEPKTDPEPAPAPEKPEVDPKPEPAPEEPKTDPEPEPAPEEPGADPEPAPVPEGPEADPEPAPVPEEPEVVPEEENEPVEEPFEADLIQAGSFTGPHSMPGDVSLFDASWEAAKQQVYQGIVAKKGLNDKNDYIPINASYNIPSSQGFTLYSEVVNEHPELFYVHTSASSWRNGSGILIGITPGYHDGSPMGNVPSENLTTAAAQTAFDKAVNAALAQLESGMTDVEKVLVLHDYLVTNCRYNWYVGTNQTEDTKTVFSAYGALVKKDAVCQGYALAYKYLLDRAGITAVTLSNSGHMWNQVEINGKWYHVDTTHDDPMPNMDGKSYHSHFLVSTAQLNAVCNGHTNMAAGAAVCTDTTYQSGYIFNDNAWPVHYRNGKLYYVKGLSGTTYEVRCSSEVNGTGEALTQFTPYLRQVGDGRYYLDSFSVVWLGDTFYYIGSMPGQTTYRLNCYNFVSGVSAQSSEAPALTNTEGAGLKYAGGTAGKFYATSLTEYDKNLATYSWFTVASTPSDWAGKTGILGVTADNKAGIRLAAAGSATLYVATYSSGRMTGVKSYPVTLKANELALVQLSSKPTSRDKLMLAMSSRPACPAYPGT